MSVVRLVRGTEKTICDPKISDSVAVFRDTSQQRSFVSEIVTDFHHDSFNPVPTADGLAAEFQSRPGRGVSVLLARVDAAPAGVAARVTAFGAGERHSISWLLVRPEYRRQGVGAALVTATLAEARAAGAAEIWVEVRRDWAAAIAFWQAVGFRVAP